MKKGAVVLLIFSLLTIVAIAGPRHRQVRGMVIDAHHHALVGAKVTVKGTNIEVYTDFEGAFTIEKLKPGTYDLVISMVSYQDLDAEEVTLAEGDVHPYIFRLSTR